jgi:hypothetical protein
MTSPNTEYAPLWAWFAAVGGIAALVFLIWFLGWIVGALFPSTKRKRAYATMGNALMRVDALLQPSRGHIIEAREYEEVEQDESGDPPEPGAPNK